MKERYKKTELGFVPKEWNLKRLEECTIKITDGSHSSPIPVNDSKYRICTVANMNRSKLDVNDAALITKEDYERLIKNGCKPEVGDILLSKDGTIGKTLVFDQIEEDIVLLSSIAIIRPNKKEIISEYLNQYLKDESTLNRLINSKTGSAIKRIVLRDIKTIKLLVPPLKEQEKIADILSTVDSQIDYTDKLIEKTKELKKGLMQRLLTKGIGHKEFKKTEVGEIPVEWEVQYLKDCISVQTGYPFKSSLFNAENIGLPLIRIRDIITSNISTFYSGEYSGEYIVKLGDILIGMDGEFNIAIWRNKDGLLNQRICRITSENNNEIYFYYVLQVILKRIEAETPATTVKHLVIKDMLNRKVSVPSKEEQNRISNILFNLDNQILDYDKKKIKLEELKKGLMQQLLIGKIRTI